MLRSSPVFSNLLRKYAAVVNSQQINYKCHVDSLHRVMFTLGFFFFLRVMAARNVAVSFCVSNISLQSKCPSFKFIEKLPSFPSLNYWHQCQVHILTSQVRAC